MELVSGVCKRVVVSKEGLVVGLKALSIASYCKLNAHFSSTIKWNYVYDTVMCS